MITLASQQGTPWSGFNGFGQVEDSGWTLAATGVWTAPDGTSGWVRNADGTYTNSVVDGLGNTIVYTVTEAMVPVNTVTVPPGGSGGEDWWTRLTDVAGNLLRVIGLGTPTITTPIPTGSSSWLNPGTWSLPMVLLIGGGVYWLASSGKRTRAAHHRLRRRRNPMKRVGPAMRAIIEYVAKHPGITMMAAADHLSSHQGYPAIHRALKLNLIRATERSEKRGSFRLWPV